MQESSRALFRASVHGPTGPDAQLMRDPARLAEAATEIVAHNLSPWLARQLDSAPWNNLPTDLQVQIRARARHQAALDALRCEELARVLDALSANRLNTLLFKGGAVGFQVYPSPEYRPRSDHDVLIRPSDLTAASARLEALGYTPVATPKGTFITRQRSFIRTDGRGVGHHLDVHWALFNRPRYQGAFDFDELWDRRERLLALGPEAFGLDRPSALIVACLHRLAHHYAEKQARVEWLLDIDLLARELDGGAWDALIETVTAARAGDACAEGLSSASELFGTPIHRAELSNRAAAERARRRADADGARWRRSLDDLRWLPGWRARSAYLREHLCPGRAFMDALHPGPGPLWWRYARRALTGLRAWL